jgi:hypothetical protein
MVLAAQFRNLSNEENLIEDKTEYQLGAVADYSTLATKQITLSETKKVLVRCTVEAFAQSGKTISGNVRILLASQPLSVTGQIGVNSATNTYYLEAFLELAAGTHTFNFQISVDACTAGGVVYCHLSFYDVYIGVFDITDADISNGESGDITCTAGVETTIISKTFTTPTAKNLPLGIGKKINCVILVAGTCTTAAATAVDLMKNVGESSTANRLNWRVYLGGVQKDWNERRDDYPTTNPTYAEGAYGRCSQVLEPNTEYTVDIKVYNGYAADKTGRCYISIIYGPWILSDVVSFEPLTLDVAEGSTIYVTVEPLSRNTNTTVSIGKKRAASFGDATDYYYTNTGTGIKGVSYTFELTNSQDCVLVAYGMGGCITLVGVDLR